jgi:hypothetical protein
MDPNFADWKPTDPVWAPKPYDPAWIINAAKRELPSEFWLHEALARCTQAVSESPAYIKFVNSHLANQSGSEWQFDTNIVLTGTDKGEVVLDILKEARPGEGLRVGGIEFLERL